MLKESPSAEVTQKISEMPAVIKVMENGGQYQIVIGTHAKDVYEEMAKLMGDTAGAEAAEVKQGLFNRIIAAMSAVFAPFIYILAAWCRACSSSSPTVPPPLPRPAPTPYLALSAGRRSPSCPS